MKEIRIELPNYEGRREDVNAIAAIAAKYNLEYDALKFPVFSIIDEETEEIIFKSCGAIKCYISGTDSEIDRFLAEIKSWIDEA